MCEFSSPNSSRSLDWAGTRSYGVFLVAPMRLCDQKHNCRRSTGAGEEGPPGKLGSEAANALASVPLALAIALTPARS